LRYAAGKHSYGYCDITGVRVPYRKLKTTWDGLRVSPEAYEDKHPQLTPAKNIHDAMALKNPRPTDGFEVGSVTSISTKFPSTSGGGSGAV
tara:strand:+ start:980 stop:1252 length:273 start_codon:yes stop_codon:yes gene_type:complete